MHACSHRTSSSVRNPNQNACMPQLPSSGTLVKRLDQKMPVLSARMDGSTGIASRAALRAAAAAFKALSRFSLRFSSAVTTMAWAAPPCIAHLVSRPVYTTIPTSASAKMSLPHRGTSCTWLVFTFSLPSAGANQAWERTTASVTPVSQHPQAPTQHWRAAPTSNLLSTRAGGTVNSPSERRTSKTEPLPTSLALPPALSGP